MDGITLYGIDPVGPVSDIETDNMVVVPESTLNLTEYENREIDRLSHDPPADDGNHGIQQYLTIRNYLETQFH